MVNRPRIGALLIRPFLHYYSSIDRKNNSRYCVFVLTTTKDLVSDLLHIGVDCAGFSNAFAHLRHKNGSARGTPSSQRESVLDLIQFSTVSKTQPDPDPMDRFESSLNSILFGVKNIDSDKHADAAPGRYVVDELAHSPSGYVMRAELFQNKSGVHLPAKRWMHHGHSYLNMTMDYMQTAVNAFAIFLDGSIEDVLRLPPTYILRSARTISMMKIAREKLVATWCVVRGNHNPKTISYQTLEYYRPLFKYVNAREIANLNLEDDRILSYIGTHAELDRHQVGVVASKYIEVNKDWRSPRYLNLMNNLLCGVPMKLMRRVPENFYLQLSHQIFYHIKACDPLQRRFYLAMMTRTQVLGKSNSWSARDVARLGLLLTEVDGPELSAINPEAMAGVTSQVMLEMSAENLKQLTKMQLMYLHQKPLNILSKKINKYEDGLKLLGFNSATRNTLFTLIIYIVCVIKVVSTSINIDYLEKITII